MMRQQQGAALSAPTFDPAAWFAMWSDHGGVAMLIGDRLWVGRTQPLELEATQTLNAIRARLTLPALQWRWRAF